MTEIGFIRAAMDGLSQRQEAIANNIANAETPGYRRLTVNFEDSLRQQMAAQERATAAVREAAAAPGVPRARRGLLGAQLAGLDGGDGMPPELDPGARNDANTVDVDREMTDLAATQLRYAGLGAALTARLQSLRAVVQNI